MNRFLALMVYVAVFLGGFTLTASLGVPDLNFCSSPVSAPPETVSQLVLDNDEEISVAESQAPSFKIVVKKKIKKRYQVRYCEYNPASNFSEKKHIIYDDVVVFCVLRSVIPERCIRTFGLRGPPSFIA